MKVNTFVVIFIIAICCNKLTSQIQVGQDLYGKVMGDNAGEAVAINATGDRIIIGARRNMDIGAGSSGHARVFEYNNGMWNQLGGDVYGDNSIIGFGGSVAISSDGSIIAVGGPDTSYESDSSGHVKLFQYLGNDWVQLGNTIYGNEFGDLFGTAISLSANGTRIAIGAPSDNTGEWNAGNISVFDFKNEIWTKIGQTFYGAYSNENMGYSLALSSDGNRLAIKRQTGGNNNGVNVRKDIEVREFDGNAWNLIAQPILGYLASYGNYISLSNNGNIVAIGVGRPFAGVYVFELNGSQWSLLGSEIEMEYITSSLSALSLSGDGKTLAIGDVLNGDAGSYSGQVRVFKFDDENSNDWEQLGIDISGLTSDYFGKGLSLSNDATRLVSGAKFGDNGEINNSGRTRVYDLNFSTLEGRILFDENENGCNNSGSPVVNSKLVLEKDLEKIISFSNNDGSFYFSLKEGVYNISFENPLFVTAPLNSEVIFNELGETKQINLCASPNGTVNDVAITLIPTSVARPGFETNYRLVYENLGNSILNGNISFQFDNDLQSYVSASKVVESQGSNALRFSYNNLLPFEKRIINIKLITDIPPMVKGGETLSFESSITSTEIDENLNNNSFVFNQIVVNSFDPNDKLVLQGEQVSIYQTGDYLSYVVRFQNTGTASAVNVRIRDILESKLDWSTFTPISASHSYNIQITEDNLVDFIFNNIELPAEQDNEPDSHGFVAFKIKPKSNVVVGDVITGEASIYFDFNAPIVTNTVRTEITNNVLSLNNDQLKLEINIYPNPTEDLVHIKKGKNISVDKVLILSVLGKELIRQEGGEDKMSFKKLPKGIYFLKIELDGGQTFIKKIIKS